MDSLSSQDAAFLYLENEFNHMHIAVVALFEGPAPGDRAIEEMIWGNPSGRTTRISISPIT